MNSVDIKLAKLNGIFEIEYSALVDKLIRNKYSISNELAILRQRDTKPDEFAEYNAYVEQCKTYAKNELGIGEEV